MLAVRQCTSSLSSGLAAFSGRDFDTAQAAFKKVLDLVQVRRHTDTTFALAVSVRTNRRDVMLRHTDILQNIIYPQEQTDASLNLRVLEAAATSNLVFFVTPYTFVFIPFSS